MTVPVLSASVPVRSNWAVADGWNSRSAGVAWPTNSGWTQSRSSSRSPCSSRAYDSWPNPYWTMSWPGCSFRRRIAAIGSPLITVVLFHSGSRSVLDTTYFGHAIDPVAVGVAGPGYPRRGEDRVGAPAPQHGVAGEEQVGLHLEAGRSDDAFIRFYHPGSATDAVADVCGLRRVDYPDDLQLDTRRQHLEQSAASAKQHRDLVELHLVQHPGLQRPLCRVRAVHQHVPVHGRRLRLRHRVLDPIGHIRHQRVVGHRGRRRPVAEHEDRHAVMITFVMIDLLRGTQAHQHRTGRLHLVEQIPRGSGRSVGLPVRGGEPLVQPHETVAAGDRKSTRLNSSHVKISYAVFCVK